MFACLLKFLVGSIISQVGHHFFLKFKGSVHENCEQYLSPMPQPTDG